MPTNDSSTWLDEALASYQPNSMTPAMWERFRVDACTLVRQLAPADERAARHYLSRLAAFLADAAAARPEARLHDLLTRDQVEGHLARAPGAVGTLRNRQGALNGLLRAQLGVPRRRPGSPPTGGRLQPYSVEELLVAATAALGHGHPDGADFARSVACVLSGVPLPTRTCDHLVGVVTDDAGVWVNQQLLEVTELCGVPSGEIRAVDVERGRRFADRHLGFELDARRGALTYLTEQVRTRPAIEVLALTKAGRDRLNTAITSCGRPDTTSMRDLLRGAALPPR